VPRYEDLDWRGLEDFERDQFERLMSTDRAIWMKEILSHEELLLKLYNCLSKEHIYLRELILSALWRSPERWGLASEKA
jgi:phosphoenolpyruvate carboxykinase (GTP)